MQVARHRLRRAPGAKVLLTTFSTTLANALRSKLDHLVGNEPAVAGRITVEAIRDLAQRYQNEGDYDKAIELDPKLAIAYGNLGNALHARGQVDEAIAALPPESALFVNWTLPNSSGFALQTNAVLNSTNSFPWSTNGLPIPLQLGLLKRTLLSSNNLPGSAQGFFRLSKPGF